VSLFTPGRQRGTEILDGDGVDPLIRRRSHRDIALSNRLFGGTHAVIAELDPVLDGRGAEVTLLDVGTGIGDIPASAQQHAASRGVTLVTFGVDGAESLVRTSEHRVTTGVRADALALPFADRSFDVVICSQVLHHFENHEARTLVQEMDRVARDRVIVSDLRRSWLAVAGLWSISFPLRFHRVSRHDGVVSILRGFTVPELRDLVYDATGHTPTVRKRFGFRITASWGPQGT
jgi:ubiquinone/menaquinone biosynthesis C-methylase UbiE